MKISEQSQREMPVCENDGLSRRNPESWCKPRGTEKKRVTCVNIFKSYKDTKVGLEMLACIWGLWIFKWVRDIKSEHICPELEAAVITARYNTCPMNFGYIGRVDISSKGEDRDIRMSLEHLRLGTIRMIWEGSREFWNFRRRYQKWRYMPTSGAREERSKPSYPPHRFWIYHKSLYILRSTEKKHRVSIIMFSPSENRNRDIE